MKKAILVLFAMVGITSGLGKELRCTVCAELKTSAARAPAAQAAAISAIGHKRFVVLRLEFPGDSTASETESECREMMEYASRCLLTNSYGKLSLSATISPIIKVPLAQAQVSGAQDIETLAWQLAEQMGIRRADYDLDVIIASKLDVTASGNIGRRGIILKKAAATSAVVHEIGHNLGLVHAKSWVGSNDSISGVGESREYGDHFDIMGSGEGSFSSWTRLRLGWLATNHVQTISASEVANVLFYETPTAQTNATYAVRVRAADKHYWIDCPLPTAQSPPDSIVIRWAPAEGGAGSTHLLDMHPQSPFLTADAPLLLGRTFSDRKRNVHITPIGKLDDGYAVKVNIGNFAGNVPPSISTTVPAVINLAIGEPFQFSASATDPDGDDVTIVWDFGVGGASAGANATHAYASNGEYSIVCEASDHKGGVAMKSFIARVGSPTSYRVSGTVTRQGVPLPNARIYVPSQETSSARTDADGRYVLTGLLPGATTLSGAFEGLALRPQNFSLPYVVTNSAENVDWELPIVFAESLAIEIPEDSETNPIRLTGQAESGFISFRLLEFPQHGILIGAPPTFQYTPDANFFGQDSFTYEALSGAVISRPATVSISVLPQADLPLLFGKEGGRAEVVMTSRLPAPRGVATIEDACAGDDGRVYLFAVYGSAGTTDLLVRCLSADGKLEWDRLLPDQGDTEVPITMIPRSDGVFIMSQTLRARFWDTTVARISSRNELLWLRSMSDTTLMVAPSKGEDAFLVAGAASGTAFVAKIEGSSGRELWRKPAPQGFVATHLDAGNDAEFFVTGHAGLWDHGPGLDCVTLKFSSAGELVWDRRFDLGANESGFQAHAAADGSIYIISSGVAEFISEQIFANWITHYSPEGTLLGRSDPFVSAIREQKIAFNQDDVAYALAINPALPTRPLLLRFQGTTPEQIWAWPTNTPARTPHSLRIAAGGAFELLTRGAGSTGWLTTIDATGRQIAEVRLRHRTDWQSIKVRPADATRGFLVLGPRDNNTPPRLAKIVNEALARTCSVQQNQTLTRWPSPIGLDAQTLFVDPTQLPEHGSLHGEWPNWVYMPATNFTGDDRIGFRAYQSSGETSHGEFKISVITPLGIQIMGGSVTLAADPALTTLRWSFDLKEWATLRGQIPSALPLTTNAPVRFFRIAE